MNPLSSSKALDQFFLEARSRILDLAATLDRLDRGAGSVQDDPRFQRLQRALQVLLESEGDRAERIQQVFSLEYDPEWQRPRPRYESR